MQSTNIDVDETLFEYIKVGYECPFGDKNRTFHR
jgi:hypothetical protein